MLPIEPPSYAAQFEDPSVEIVLAHSLRPTHDESPQPEPEIIQADKSTIPPAEAPHTTPSLPLIPLEQPVNTPRQETLDEPVEIAIPEAPYTDQVSEDLATPIVQTVAFIEAPIVPAVTIEELEPLPMPPTSLDRVETMESEPLPIAEASITEQPADCHIPLDEPEEHTLQELIDVDTSQEALAIEIEASEQAFDTGSMPTDTIEPEIWYPQGGFDLLSSKSYSGSVGRHMLSLRVIRTIIGFIAFKQTLTLTSSDPAV